MPSITVAKKEPSISYCAHAKLNATWVSYVLCISSYEVIDQTKGTVNISIR